MKEFGLVLNKEQAEMLREVSMNPNKALIRKLDAAMKELEDNVRITEDGFSFELPIDIKIDASGDLVERKTDMQVQDKYECAIGEGAEMTYKINISRLSFRVDLNSIENLCAA